MYSKEDALKIKREFWIEFAAQYPRKWIMYTTDIKDFSFKFYTDNKNIKVILDIENKEEEKRKIYFEKIESLKTILETDYIKDLVFEKNHQLENGKIISRIWIEKNNISMNNRNNWVEIFSFFNEKMDLFEQFFLEYKDYIKDLELNT
ncbi:DUF4268 domain-containing protein [Flavobacterium sp.]|uniref:DUF4268 domain-containing protein n=1 Tax=Flavobacterium sp. TaxID=239 RepID=UPI003752F000